METIRQFEARVIARTGVAMSDMPREALRDGDTLPARILAARPPLFVCGAGYPTVTEDGEEVYDRFVLAVVA